MQIKANITVNGKKAGNKARDYTFTPTRTYSQVTGPTERNRVKELTYLMQLE
jgi:hypothetical protein